MDKKTTQKILAIYVDARGSVYGGSPQVRPEMPSYLWLSINLRFPLCGWVSAGQMRPPTHRSTTGGVNIFLVKKSVLSVQKKCPFSPLLSALLKTAPCPSDLPAPLHNCTYAHTCTDRVYSNLGHPVWSMQIIARDSKLSIDSRLHIYNALHVKQLGNVHIFIIFFLNNVFMQKSCPRILYQLRPDIHTPVKKAYNFLPRL